MYIWNSIMYIYLYTYVYILMDIHTYITYVQINITYMCIIYTFIHSFIRSFIHTYIYREREIHVFIYICILVHVCTYIFTYSEYTEALFPKFWTQHCAREVAATNVANQSGWKVLGAKCCKYHATERLQATMQTAGTSYA